MPKVILIPASTEGGEEVRLEIDMEAVMGSELIKQMIEDSDSADEDQEIPIPDVPKAILEKVIEFLIKHKSDPMREIQKPISTNNLEEIVGKWDADFVDLEQEPLFRLILAANYLSIQPLLDLGLCKLACMIKDKDPNEIKELFHIEKDITPEEERKVREENPWIFEVTPAVPSAGAR